MALVSIKSAFAVRPSSICGHSEQVLYLFHAGTRTAHVQHTVYSGITCR